MFGSFPFLQGGFVEQILSSVMFHCCLVMVYHLLFLCVCGYCIFIAGFDLVHFNHENQLKTPPPPWYNKVIFVVPRSSL